MEVHGTVITQNMITACAGINVISTCATDYIGVAVAQSQGVVAACRIIKIRTFDTGQYTCGESG